MTCSHPAAKLLDSERQNMAVCISAQLAVLHQLVEHRHEALASPAMQLAAMPAEPTQQTRQVEAYPNLMSGFHAPLGQDRVHFVIY